MAKSKKSGSQVIQGGVNLNIQGNATIGEVVGRDKITNISFAPVYHAIKKNATISPKTKKAVEQSVKEIEKESSKGDNAKVSFIQKRLENIEKMAPDIADVVMATLQNPVAGISMALRKVLAKIQAERATPG